jgi:hypothetical protein
MDRVFGTVAYRTRSRLDAPALRTLFGVMQRPAGADEPSMKLALVIEKPAYDLTKLKVHLGLLTLKGYTKGDRVLRFEAIVHNAKTLKTGRAWTSSPRSLPAWRAWPTGSAPCWTASIPGFIPDGTLDELPLPAQRVLGLGSADGDEVANADISGTRVEHEATESVG